MPDIFKDLNIGINIKMDNDSIILLSTGLFIALLLALFIAGLALKKI